MPRGTGGSIGKLTAHGGGGDAATEQRGDGGAAGDGHGRALQEHGGRFVVDDVGGGGSIGPGRVVLEGVRPVQLGFEKWSDLARSWEHPPTGPATAAELAQVLAALG